MIYAMMRMLHGRMVYSDKIYIYIIYVHEMHIYIYIILYNIDKNI